MSPETFLRVQDLTRWYPIRRGVLRRTVGYVKAVDGVSLEIRPGETLGVVGESGCGKSTLARTLVALEEPTSGSIEIRLNGALESVSSLAPSARRDFRRSVQIVFQNPKGAMNPRMSVFDIIAEPLRIHGMRDVTELTQRVYELLTCVGLQPIHARRFPDAFSGGQLQRIGIARALALNPLLIIADEPVSALDVSVQAQILNLLRKLKHEFSLSYLFIAHNLNVVKYISDRIAVMYLGRIVEIGPAERVFAQPLHPYTRSLVAALPATHPSKRKTMKTLLRGDLPDPASPPQGCHFHPRCRFATDICRTADPVLQKSPNAHWSACHHSDSLIPYSE